MEDKLELNKLEHEAGVLGLSSNQLKAIIARGGIQAMLADTWHLPWSKPTLRMTMKLSDARTGLLRATLDEMDQVARKGGITFLRPDVALFLVARKGDQDMEGTETADELAGLLSNYRIQTRQRFEGRWTPQTGWTDIVVKE